MEGNYCPRSVGHGDDQIGSGRALTVVEVRSLSITSQPGGARSLLNVARLDGVGVAWLGQAGFALRYEDLRILLDPYLSNYLEKKYRDTDKPHERLMAAPIQAQELKLLDFVICTHQHSDHMDPEALPILASKSPAARFIIPRASREHLLKLGVPDKQVAGINAGERMSLSSECSVEAIPSAHETLEKNERGEYRYLGYFIRLGSLTFYHSGDTVPYPGLSERVSTHSVDLALLPINGRGKGVAGNFTFDEAVQLCQVADIPYFIPHHFGMFAFNTVDRKIIEASVKQVISPVCLLPTTNNLWVIQ
jgi:L-ascorbate metabolism protein UlaG (beta-lactamase superfamily)